MQDLVILDSLLCFSMVIMALPPFVLELVHKITSFATLRLGFTICNSLFDKLLIGTKSSN